MATIVFLVVAGVIVFEIIEFILNKSAKEERAEATLVKKEYESFVDDNNMIQETHILYFEVNEKKKKFYVESNVYSRYRENQTGELVYKRNSFVDFIVASNS